MAYPPEIQSFSLLQETLKREGEDWFIWKALRREWRQEALCKGEDMRLWFPEKGQNTWEGKEVCRACPVQVECLGYALVTKQGVGTWGGVSPRKRRRMREAVEEYIPADYQSPETAAEEEVDEHPKEKASR